jgi:hypothetical protein
MTVRGAAQLQLQAVELLGHNRAADAEEAGGAVAAVDVEQVSSSSRRRCCSGYPSSSGSSNSNMDPNVAVIERSDVSS